MASNAFQGITGKGSSISPAYIWDKKVLSL